VLNARVRGVYGTVFTLTLFISTLESELLSELLPPVICISSTSILSAAREAADGIMLHIERIKFAKNIAIIIIVAANAPLACRQYPRAPRWLAKSQLFVMYQALLDGRLGSELSGPACPYILAAYNPTRTAFVMALNIGSQICKANKMTLTIMMKRERTEMATLKSVRACDQTNGVDGIGLWLA